MLNRLFAWAVLPAMICLAAVLLLAAPAWAVSHPIDPGDFLGNLVNAIGMPLITVIVPLAVAGFKKIMPKIPTFLLPIIATGMGPLVDQIIALLAGIESHGWVAVALGMAGVCLREIVDQIKKLLAAA